MNVSVVIPCINEQLQIAGAVESARQSGVAQVIVVDGGSADATREIARGCADLLMECPPGRGSQMNAGAAQARGDVLLFLHADCRLPTDACRQITDGLNSLQRQWGCFRQRIASPRRIYRWIEKGNGARVQWQRLAYGDQAIFVRRTIFWAVGGFDEVPLMEDVMLSQKLNRSSRPLLLPGPVVVDARRWQQHGPLRQTLRNWWLMARFRSGASPQQLAASYRRHDAIS